MNVMGLREAKTKLTALGKQSQKGKAALVTRRGRPFFVVVGVEGEDLVDVLVKWDPSFWKDLEERRGRSAGASISLDEFEASELPGPGTGGAKGKARPQPQASRPRRSGTKVK